MAEDVMRSHRLALLAIGLAMIPGSGVGGPVDLSSTQDAALRQLIEDSGDIGAGAGKKNAAGGNPFLAKRAHPAPGPKSRSTPASSSEVDAPIDLLARPGAVPGVKPEAAPPVKPAPAVQASKTAPAKKAAATVVKAAKAAPVPLPRPRPAGGPTGEVPPTPKPGSDEQVAGVLPKVGPKDEPVSGGAAPAPAVPVSAIAATHPASADDGPSSDSAGEAPGEAAPPAALPANAPPYRLVRALQHLQDQTAQGSAAAFVAERQLRSQIEEAFAKADAKLWQDPLNAAAAVTFVLSGGSPSVLHHIATLTPPPAIDAKLLEGALAYVEGRVEEASKALADVDASDLPASMAGQMALAQAALAVATDPQRSIQLLDSARMLAPGTLVEEAALRREILVADQVGDEEKFETLSRQYLARFRHSVYAGNFRYRFASILTHLKFADEAAQAKTLDEMFRDLEPGTARELYLTVARAAVLQGKAKAAIMAGERAGNLAVVGSADQARAHLYRAAGYAVLPDGFDSATAEAKAIRPELLKGADLPLRDAATFTIKAIGDADDVADKRAGDPAAPKSAEPSPIMIRAETALQRADALLAETAP